MISPATALIIDDEADIRELVAMTLDRIGLDTHTAANLEEARHLLETYQFDVCLTDMKLPDGDGVEFVKYLQHSQPTLPVAVVTAHGNMTAAVEAMKNGAFDFVSKPVNIKLLRTLVLQAIELGDKRDEQSAEPQMLRSTSTNTIATLSIADSIAGSRSGSRTSSSSGPESANADTYAETNADTRESLTLLSGRSKDNPSLTAEIGAGKLIGKSDAMKNLRSMIGKVARTNAPVWITGESGTGKELIARLIHENSSRANRPFIAINCGAIPSELMDSEMFGHKKGSFTGAHADHDGLFKRAEGGTLFLDEVAELPLHMQVKLLRAIQERAVRPVGSAFEIDTDVRILSASHKDLNGEVSNGTFRHDLYYRLNVISIEAPPLRARREDVPDISRHILANIALKEDNNATVALSLDAETHLISYDFPGNVRELENILERAVALSEHRILDISDLKMELNTGSAAKNLTPATMSKESNVTLNTDTERNLILEALQNTRWNRKEAAKALGMSYRQIRYRIQQYGIGDSSGNH